MKVKVSVRGTILGRLNLIEAFPRRLTGFIVQTVAILTERQNFSCSN